MQAEGGTAGSGAEKHGPTSSTLCAAASRCCAAAFSASGSASSCVEPRCPIPRDPRCEKYTTCTAVAPDAVLAVRTSGTRPPQDP